MPNDQNVLSWTPANWITVLIMGGLGLALVGAITRAWAQRKGGA